ncbi:hypothetical protein D1614_22850 [Maribellus luteus]|uniref:SF3 helicase domain-containing protein n=1 Tax=Maribellus luteus TaxID=2305463 RepID=A0A399SP90_9BACT|nr:hypothetical protein [Maribellus luteus]RIJ45510.1 hypothetical protein D1614_22850 [Maribellus luteus]
METRNSVISEYENNSQNRIPEVIFWTGEGQISPHLLYEFFASKGIGLYYPDEKTKKKGEPMIVKVDGNLVSEVGISYLLGLAKEHIIEVTAENGESGPILDSLHRNTSLFGDKNLKLLPPLNLKFLDDTKEAGYFFFSNGILKVTAEKITLNNYEDYDEYIWESSIIDFPFNLVNVASLINSSDFMQFLRDLTVVNEEEQSLKRLKSLSTAIGYLLHKFKDGTTNKAIILMDMFVNGLPNGGSGKTLLISAIGKIRNLAIVDGKKYDQREWFELSSVELDTGILLFDDVKKDFDFEQIFALMTTGLYRRRKYENHVFIPHEKAPKVAITTNYAINGESNSFKRRMWEFEVSSTFNADFTPRDKYSKNFFDEWNETEWNFFYNTMLRCLQLYMKEGLIEPEPINLRYTKLVNSTCEEFIEFANHHIELNTQLDKKVLYLNFIKEYPEYKYQLNQRTFTHWLRTWGAYNKYKVVEGHTGSTRYILFVSHPIT